MSDLIIDLLSRIQSKGYYSYTFQPGEKQLLFEEYNRLVREKAISGSPEYATGCGACVSKVYNRLAVYANSVVNG